MARPHEVHFGWMHYRLFKIKRDSLVDPKIKKGDTVKVVMVSRMGDCGVTKNLSAEHGYSARFMPYELEPIEPVPDNVCKLCHYELESDDHQKCSWDRKCDECGEETGPGDPVCRVCIFKNFLTRCKEEKEKGP